MPEELLDHNILRAYLVGILKTTPIPNPACNTDFIFGMTCGLVYQVITVYHTRGIEPDAELIAEFSAAIRRQIEDMLILITL